MREFESLWKSRKLNNKLKFPPKRANSYRNGPRPPPLEVLSTIFKALEVPRKSTLFEPGKRHAPFPPHVHLAPLASVPDEWPVLGSASERNEADREAALEYARSQLEKYRSRGALVYFTDGSADPPSRGGGAAAAAIPPTGPPITKYVGPIAGNNEAEAVAITMALEHAINQTDGHSPVAILSDCQNAILEAIQPLTSHHDRWAIIAKTHQLLRRMATDGRVVMIDWVPGHAGLDGNEEADKQAKECLARAKASSAPYDTQITASALRYHLEEMSRKTWQGWWDRHDTAADRSRVSHFKQLCPKLEHRLSTEALEDVPNISVRTRTCLRRLRLADTRSNKAKFREKQVTSPLCECGEDDGYIHKFAHCPETANARLELQENLVQMHECLTVAATLQTPRLGRRLRTDVLARTAHYLDSANLTTTLVGARQEHEGPEEGHTELPPHEDPDLTSSDEDSQPPETNRRPTRTLMDYFRPRP